MFSIKRVINRLLKYEFSSKNIINRNKSTIGVKHSYKWNQILFMTNFNETVGNQSQTDISHSVGLSLFTI
jgi:hypothetical protein